MKIKNLYIDQSFIKQQEFIMDPLLILLSGIIVVVGGIIFFKLHPVLALLIAALTVALLTPESYVYKFFLGKGLADAEALKAAQKHRGKDCHRIR